MKKLINGTAHLIMDLNQWTTGIGSWNKKNRMEFLSPSVKNWLDTKCVKIVSESLEGRALRPVF